MKDLIQLIIYLYFMHLMFVSPNYMNLTLMTLLTILFVLKYWRLKEKLANTKIRTKNACKKILSKERKYYTDSLTHDLKVPVLAQLRGINLLKEEILGGLNTEQKELINQIGDSCRYTLEMIAMLANIYKFDDINYELNYEKFSMSDLLLSCFEELSNETKEKNLTFSYISEDDTTVEADKIGIRKVILNILLSLINYSSRGDEIKVEINSEGETLFFSASGIGEKNIANTDYSTVGHRISLHLCKKIVEIHKGQIFTYRNKNQLCFKIPKFSKLFSITASAVQ